MSRQRRGSASIITIYPQRLNAKHLLLELCGYKAKIIVEDIVHPMYFISIIKYIFLPKVAKSVGR